MEKIYDKEQFYSHLVYDRMQLLMYERPLSTEHLKPVEDVLFQGKELTPFSHELFTYQEARQCVLDFDIYTLSEYYDKYPNVVDLVIDCYRLAAKEGVTEAYNNIGVFYTMTGKVDKAVPFFMEAANAGLATGLTNMMGYYGMLEDNEHMMEYVKKLAAIGDAAGMWNYALAYHFGYIGRKPDISKAKDMYQRLLTLPFREGKELSDETEIMLLKIKTMACYNLAQILYLSEEPNDENLCGIIRLLEETPYVIIDNKKIKDLKEEIYQGYGVEYKYH